jgi:predicted metal-dependent phosphotriesterase family hydrolase
MHEKAIRRLDRAAQEMVQALKTHGEELQPYLGDENLDALQTEVVNLRRVLLGLSMGELYQDWEPPADVSVADTAAEVVNLLKAKK